VPRIVARGPEANADLAVEVDEETAVVIGRAPERLGAPAVDDLQGRRVATAEISGATVSANHVAAWVEAGSVCVEDVGSRNGTWLELPRGRVVRVAGVGDDVVLHLAPNIARGPGGDAPVVPAWTTDAEYDRGIAEAIERWLAARGVQVRARITAEARETDALAACFPLATGRALELVLGGTTTDTRWPRLLERLWRWIHHENATYSSEEATRRDGAILASRAIRAVHAEVVAAAERGVQTLLIVGPSGSGKEMLAEVFHRHSGRAGPLVTVNCAILDGNLLRSELFGAEAGSFTTGTRRIVGAVERAQGGTLFLDEIGEMKPGEQAMLLRFFDNREVATIGRYGVASRADVRIIAATNRDLRRETQSGQFRADLWFRLSVCEVEVPPLRARWDDVLAYLQAERTSDGRTIREALSPEALDLLRAHRWEGNFRELRSFTERLLAAGLPDRVDAATCRRALERVSLGLSFPPARPLPDGAPTDWAELMHRSVRAFVEDHEREPTSWDDQREWNERFLKPLVFFHLSGAPPQAPATDEALRALAAKAATRLRADRGTAARHLVRYYERYQK
jgi:DNA-binding NtrC family response regulator